MLFKFHSYSGRDENEVFGPFFLASSKTSQEVPSSYPVKSHKYVSVSELVIVVEAGN